MAIHLQPLSSMLFPTAIPFQAEETPPENINVQDEIGNTPLHTACTKGAVARVEWLIKKKADVNRPDKGGFSPIWAAVIRRKFDIAKRLLDAGATSPPELLFAAIMKGERGLVQWLLEHRANPNEQSTWNPLWAAAISDRPDVISLLIKYGAHAHYISEMGTTPLFEVYRSNVPSLEPYRTLEKADGGLTEHLITLRLAGHRFSLEGALYAGLGPRITFPSFAKTLDHYAEENWTERTWKQIPAESLRQAVNRSKQAKDYIRDWENRNIVTIRTGVTLHAISVVLFQDWLAIGNRSFGAEDCCGISFYKMHSIEPLEQVIESLLRLGEASHPTLTIEEILTQNLQEIPFFNKEIHSLLGLRLHGRHELQPHLTGNCGYVAAKLSCLAILTFLHLTKDRSVQEAEVLAYPIYKAVVIKDRELAIQDLDGLDKKEPKLSKIVSFAKLYESLWMSPAKFGSTMLQQTIGKNYWLYNPPTMPKIEDGVDGSTITCVPQLPKVDASIRPRAPTKTSRL